MSKVNDLTGMTFGKLKVLQRAGSNKHGRAIWQCECSCDNHTIINVTGNSLLRGYVKSCGCLSAENGRQRIEDLTGQIFGRLKVLEMCDHVPGERVKWRCECLNDGNIVEVPAQSLKSGGTQSCGCLHEEVFHNIISSHGLHDHPLYSIWCGMRSRCNNKNEKGYEHYGGRGITVCDEWNDFEQFYSDMKDGYQDGLQIDRIDNNKGYSKDNCRWVTPKDNCRNTRRNCFVKTSFGEITIAEFAEKLNAPDRLVRSMLYNGHSVQDVEDRFESWDGSYTPKKRIKLQTPYGSLNKGEFAEKLGVSRGYITRHIQMGETVEEIIESIRSKNGNRN